MKLFSKFWKKKEVTVAVIPLQGAIFAPKGLCLNSVAPLVDQALALNPTAVILDIDCPGGSPVETFLISQYIIRKANESKVPVLSFVRNVAASGGYWLAMTAPLIFATDMSILGSIGVVSAGFGFDKLIEQVGIERRVHTAGKSKFLNDPFQPETPEGEERIKNLQATIHDIFIKCVKAHREGKLKEDDRLFDGSIFLGEEALELGLIDGLYSCKESQISQMFAPRKVNFKVVTPKKKGLLGLLKGIVGDEVFESFFDALEVKVINKLTQKGITL